MATQGLEDVVCLRNALVISDAGREILRELWEDFCRSSSAPMSDDGPPMLVTLVRCVWVLLGVLGLVDSDVLFED